VDVIDVGQGESVLIQYKGYTLLFDMGPDHTTLEQLGNILPPLKKEIDIALISHPHTDHYFGMFNIIESYTISNSVISRLVAENYTYRQLLETLKHTNTLFGIKDQTLITIDDLKIRLIQLPPPYNNRNNGSIAAFLAYGENSILITGDLEKDFEQKLLIATSLPTITWYVAGHHGSDTSSGVPLLRTIRPENTAISVGANNSFGHPDPEAMERLAEFSNQIFRTDEYGTIHIECAHENCVTNNIFLSK
jgi:competence protein ComEC